MAPVSVSISAAAGTGLAELTEAIRQVVGLSHFDPTAAIIANARQLECITAARRSLGEGIEALAAGETPDSGLFYQGEGDSICFLAGDRGGNIAYCGTVYSEPALQPDGSLLFWPFSLYLVEDDENFVGWGPGNKYTPVEARATPVRLVPSDNGWRVAEYSLPN